MPALPLATQARNELAALLGTVTGFKVHAVAPAVPIANCLVIVPDSPWITPERAGSVLNYRLRLKVLIVVDARVNVQGIAKAEAATEKVLIAIGRKFQVDQVSAPSLTDVGAQGSVLVTEVTTTSHITP